jgi:succinate dehydrogenase / fumarate reductase cytochrome b subunit
MINTSVGRKVFMALTGQVMILFAIVHLVGNSTIYFGGLNSYAEHLHSLPALVWATRVFMLPVLFIHIIYAVILTLENYEASGQKYARSSALKSTFASRNMIWSGVLISAFIVYHLMQFTFQSINPEFAAYANMDSMGRPDVASMVMAGLGNTLVLLVYIVSLGGLFLHLAHGAQSSMQTLGFGSDSALPIIYKLGYTAAIVIALAYITIPVTIFAGILKG